MKAPSRPEYETLGACGSMLMNADPVCANVLNWLCNEYGYDTISFGGTIAWLMECYNKKIFTLEELDGIDLKWGDPDAILAVAQKSAITRASPGAESRLERRRGAFGKRRRVPRHGARD